MAGTGGETITRSLEMGEHQERTLGMPGDTDWDGTERRDGDERRTRERREYSEATDIATLEGEDNRYTMPEGRRTGGDRREDPSMPVSFPGAIAVSGFEFLMPKEPGRSGDR